MDDSSGLETNDELESGHEAVDAVNGKVRLVCLNGLPCSGLPAWEHRDLETLRKNAHANLDRLMPHVEAGAKVLVINPVCALTMRREYLELLADGDRERAKKLAAAVEDVGEFLWTIRKEERFSRDFRTAPDGPLAFHTPCHLLVPEIGFEGRDLLRMMPGVVPGVPDGSG